MNLTEGCSFCWGYREASVQGAPRLIGFIPGNIFLVYWILICNLHRRPFLLLVFQISFGLRGKNSHWVNPWNFFVGCWRLIYKHHRILFILLGLQISVGPWVTKFHWVNPWEMFGRFIFFINQQQKKEELGVILSRINNLNWLLTVMNMLLLNHRLLCMAKTMKILTNKTWLQTQNLKPQFLQLKSTSFIGTWLILRISDSEVIKISD